MEFKTIRNIVSDVVGRRIPPGGFEELYQRLNQAGQLNDYIAPLLFAIIIYLDKKEKEK